MAFETSQETTMCSYGLIEQHLWIRINLVECLRMWLTPAIGTGEVTSVDIGRHLHATAALDTVEGTLVTCAIILQTLFCPVAYFDATVFSDEMVGLLCELCPDGRLNLSHRTLHGGIPPRPQIPQRGWVGRITVCSSRLQRIVDETCRFKQSSTFPCA